METRALTDKIVCSGALFYAKSTRKFLLVQKANGKHEGTWGLVGGTNLQNENPWQGLQREVQEEIGQFPTVIKSLPLETFVSNDKVFNFHTYLCVLEAEFMPVLSEEHCGWGWFDLQHLPKPLHNGLALSLRNKVMQTKIQTIVDVINLL